MMLKLSCLEVSVSRDGARGVHLVDLERHGVGFEGFFIVVLALLDEGPDVPAYMRLEVLAHAVLDEGDACVALAEVDHDEALHAHGFCGKSAAGQARQRGTRLHAGDIS